MSMRILGIIVGVWVGAVPMATMIMSSFIDGLIWPLILMVRCIKRLREIWNEYP